MADTKKQGILSVLDFCVEIYKEKIDGRGEDCFFYSALDEKAVFGVFDGCGGSGARRYEKLQGKTGAYMASRVISGATKDWYDSTSFLEGQATNTLALEEIMQGYLTVCKREGETTSSIKGKMSKSFPTTAAIICCTPDKGKIIATCIWAGDSRCYKLDETGLMQLTEDDISGLDAMENLTADGGLTNVISASNKIRLHSKQVEIKRPCILFTATDGCFGYLSTPMEFEYLLVDTLVRSKSVDEWERNLTEFLKNTAGDDFSLCGCSIGYGTLDNLQNRFKPRRSYLLTEYINGIEGKSSEEKSEMWREYAANYSIFLCMPSKIEPEKKDYEKSVVEEDKCPTPAPQPKSIATEEKKDVPAPPLNSSDKNGLQRTCVKCGASISDNNSFCPVCGNDMRKPVIREIEPEKKTKGFKKPTDLD